MNHPVGTELVSIQACPFCREAFSRENIVKCPHCGLQLVGMDQLIPDQSLLEDDFEDLVPAHMETLPIFYLGRGRALYLLLSVIGMVLFFSPWVYELSPENQTLTGYDLATRLPWIWAFPTAYFVMIPLILSRRSIYKMRGSRVAVGFLSSMALLTVLLRYFLVPASSKFRPVHIEWAWGLFASGAVAMVSLAAAVWFGGNLVDLPTNQKRRGDEILN